MSISAAFLDSEIDDLQAIAADQRREIAAGKTIDDDLNYAFELQLQEAINASLSSHHQQPITDASGSRTPEIKEPPGFIDAFSEEVEKLERELEDKAFSQREFKKLKTDLHLRIHDYNVAREVHEMEDAIWEKSGDYFERPFGGEASNGSLDEVRVYFKGSVETQTSDGVPLVGIGIAICDSRDELLFEMRKPVPFSSKSQSFVELRAMIEALSLCVDLELKRVSLFCSCYSVFKYVNGTWKPKQRKVSDLVAELLNFRVKFKSCQVVLVPGNEVKFAFKLAREAVVSQVIKAESSSSANRRYTCEICMEEREMEQIFSIDTCLHRYCFSCMRQHVEVKLLHGVLPTCPHEHCSTELTLDTCRKLLTPRWLGIMEQRITEASIPVTDKLYCPYANCSALMSKRDVPGSSKTGGSEANGAKQCIKCFRYFCINCKVPWHCNMTCNQYRSMNPYPLRDDAKIKNLATKFRWRQCVKCNHLIELAAGCYHITCRCGYEFCYTCEAEWKKGRATCKCPLWDEELILQEDEDEDEDEDDGFF